MTVAEDEVDEVVVTSLAAVAAEVVVATSPAVVTTGPRRGQ
jgi:hypothetical protein